MVRVALVLVLVAAGLLAADGAVAQRTSSQPAASPTVTPMSEVFTAGDWTFQVLEVERLDTYSAEQFGQVYDPEGVFLVVGLAITYTGTSTSDVDRLVQRQWFEITEPSGEVHTYADIFAEFDVEESYRDDFPLPPLPLSGAAEPGVTHFKRFIFDVPADATGLTLTSHASAPGEFAIPLPDSAEITGLAAWELEVTGSTLHESLNPPLTNNAYTPEGVYLAVDVRLTRLEQGDAAIGADWFTLQTPDGETYEVVLEESLELGLPSFADGPGEWEFALVFDVPPGTSDATLVSTPGAPLRVEIPLNPVVAPPASPTALPTATSTPAPTAAVAPTAAATAEPEPGAIRVVTTDATTSVSPGSTGAVELILDTSGSMLQPMGDQLRIDVARQVLTDVVSGQLPPGTQTALRVFGTVPGSCETSLAIPLAPLDPVAASATVSTLQAVNEVRTPLGASLEAAGNDLAAVEGPKLIVLITDGEETCGGDPGAVISGLAARGIDVRVNIVGFAIDDPAIEAQLAAWAEQGGGSYFVAADAEALGPALNQALQPTFDVRDSDGFLVGSGTVNGDAVPAPEGRYTVEVHTDPPVTFEQVVVEPGQTTEVTLDGGG